MRLQQDDNIPLYPTLIVLSDNPSSSRDDAMDLLASHIDVTAEDIEIVCSNFFKDDDEARMSDIFDEIRVDVTPGTGRNDEMVDVREFTIADNGTVRELSISAMLEALGSNDNADYDLVFSKLKITSPGLVPFNWQDPKVNALTKKLPKFGLTSDGTVTVSREMSLKDMISVVTLQLREWCHPRNHAESMWSRLWESIAVDCMCERPNENLDFNPMTRDSYSMSGDDLDYDSLYDVVTDESKRRRSLRNKYEKRSYVFGKNELRKLRPNIMGIKESRNSVRRSLRTRKNESHGIGYEELMPALVDSFNQNKRSFNVNTRYSCFYRMLSDHRGILTIRNYLSFEIDILDRVEVRYADTHQMMCGYDTGDFRNVSDLADSIIFDIFHTM